MALAASAAHHRRRASKSEPPSKPSRGRTPRKVAQRHPLDAEHQQEPLEQLLAREQAQPERLRSAQKAWEPQRREREQARPERLREREQEALEQMRALEQAQPERLREREQESQERLLARDQLRQERWDSEVLPGLCCPQVVLREWLERLPLESGFR